MCVFGYTGGGEEVTLDSRNDTTVSGGEVYC
jgi:hypothetical protein